MRPWPSRAAFLWALAVAAGFVFARFLVYRAMPARLDPMELVETESRADAAFRAAAAMRGWSLVSLESRRKWRALRRGFVQKAEGDRWCRRDDWMTLPRLAGLLLCLITMGRYGGRRRWGWHFGLPAGPAVVLGICMAGWIMVNGSQTWVYRMGRERLWWGWLATIPVAAFEEALFRGLMQTALAEAAGPVWSCVGASLLFTAWHIQAQPLWDWPRIFLYGLVAGAAFARGVGLPWLMLQHFIVDAHAYAWMGGSGDIDNYGRYLAGSAFLLASAVAAIWMLRAPAPGNEGRLVAQAAGQN